MRVGVPKEIKEEEYRVALTPAGTRELTDRGHQVVLERDAGSGSLFSDEAYVAAGARIVPDAEAVFAQADLIVKVKEPLPEEYRYLEPRHMLFTFLHLAPDKKLTQALIDSGATCLAYETVETPDGHRPLLAPMSEIAGRLAPQVGAYFLERAAGARASCWAEPPGSRRPTWSSSAQASRAGTRPSSLAGWVRTPRYSTSTEMRCTPCVRMLPAVQTLHSDQLTIEDEVTRADVVIGAVLHPGARAPVLVSEDLVGPCRRARSSST